MCALLVVAIVGAGMDTENHYSAPIEGEGRVEIEPVAGGKMFQGSWLIVSGTRYVVGYRPMPELFKFIGKRVVFKGRPYRPGRDAQHIMASHLKLDHIALAPGETPHAVEPTELPPPPTARTLKELAHGWMRVVGTLESVSGDGYWVAARLRFADGTIDLPSVQREEWAPHVGKVISSIGRVGPEKERDVLSLEPQPPARTVFFGMTICPGDVPDCGMTKATPRTKATR